MLANIRELLKPVLVTVMAYWAGEGCIPAVPPEATYAAETAACVEKAQTLQESRDCRMLVNVKYRLCETERTDIPCPTKKN